MPKKKVGIHSTTRHECIFILKSDLVEPRTSNTALTTWLETGANAGTMSTCEKVGAMQCPGTLEGGLGGGPMPVPKLGTRTV